MIAGGEMLLLDGGPQPHPPIAPPGPLTPLSCDVGVGGELRERMPPQGMPTSRHSGALDPRLWLWLWCRGSGVVTGVV